MTDNRILDGGLKADEARARKVLASVLPKDTLTRRAVLSHSKCGSISIKQCLRAMLAFAAERTPQPAPDGDWVMVPREPTEAMLEAIVRQAQKPTGWHDVYPAMYRALLSACPAPPIAEDGEGVREARETIGKASAFMRHDGLCGIVGGYGYCTCGLDDAKAKLAALSVYRDVGGKPADA